MKCQLCKREHEDVHSLPLRSKIYFICEGCAKWLEKLLEDEA